MLVAVVVVVVFPVFAAAVVRLKYVPQFYHPVLLVVVIVVVFPVVAAVFVQLYFVPQFYNPMKVG